MNSDKYWLCLFLGLAFFATVITLAGIMYSNATNEKILRADTCEKVMAINGSLLEKYIVCVKEQPHAR